MNEITESQGKEAFELHENILTLKRQMGMAFITLGGFLKRMRDEEHFKVLGFDNFRSYINSELGFKWRSAYHYIEIHEWFIEKLEFKTETLADTGYTNLIRLLPILREEHKTLESSEFKKKAEDLLVQVKELRPFDFNKQRKDKELQGEDYLTPPEYIKCSRCGKWRIILPLKDACPEWINDVKKFNRK